VWRQQGADSNCAYRWFVAVAQPAGLMHCGPPHVERQLGRPLNELLLTDELKALYAQAQAPEFMAALNFDIQQQKGQ
jgi:hypothetical protein